MKNKTVRAMVAVAAVAIAGAALAETEVVDGITWTYTVIGDEVQIGDGSNAAIPTDTAGAVVIPSELGGKPVTSLGRKSFYNCSALTSVTIPFGVTTISSYAFDGCSGLTEIHLPRTVSSIYAASFNTARNIASITVDPANATYKSIDGVVYTKDGKKLVTIPSAKTAVTLPDTLEEIGAEAFSYTEIQVVKLPESLRKISTHAFYDSSILQITIPGGVTDIAAEAFWSASLSTNVTIKPGAQPLAIGARAFKYNYQLESISISPNVASIGADAFYETKLSTVYYSIGDTEERVRGLVEGTGYAGAVTYVQRVVPYVVTFDGNGGTPDFESMLVTNTLAYGELPGATLSGYSLAGWFTATEGGEQVTAETTVELYADQTLYAHWTKNSVEPGTAVELTFDDIGYKPPEGEGFTYAFKGLPAGLKYDSKSGKIVGKATKPGDYEVTVTAKNKANPKGVVGTVAMKVANFTDGQIPVEDSYGPYIPGVGYVETIDAAAGCKASGLPSGMKWTDKAVTDKTLGDVPAHSLYGAPTKPGKYTVTFTKTVDKVKHTASATFVVGPFPKLTVKIAGTGSGKVTGAGAYAAGKKVTLKATADTKDAAATDKKPETKKSVFLGYYDGETLVTNVATYSLVMPSTDLTITAKFITAAEDAAAVTASVGDVAEFDALNVSEEASVSAGVYLEWPVAAAGLTPVSVKVAGLPAGLKFTAKDIMKKGSKTEVEVRANTIYGAPTAASKKDKNGKVVPSAIKVTVTTAGKTVVNYTLETTVEALPDWAVGTFNGGGANGQAALTVAANGKISGKYLSEGKTWTLSAAYLDSYDEAEDEYVATLTAKSGKDERSETIRISEDDVGGVILATGGLGLFSFVQTNWKVDPWKSIGAKFAKKTFELVGTEAGLPTDDDKVTLTFAASGSVTAKGEFAAYGKKYSASGSSTLIPLSEPEGEADEFDCGAVVYFPPKSGKFDGFAKIVRLHWTGEKFIPDNPE